MKNYFVWIYSCMWKDSKCQRHCIRKEFDWVHFDADAWQNGVCVIFLFHSIFFIQNWKHFNRCCTQTPKTHNYLSKKYVVIVKTKIAITNPSDSNGLCASFWNEIINAPFVWRKNKKRIKNCIVIVNNSIWSRWRASCSWLS